MVQLTLNSKNLNTTLLMYFWMGQKKGMKIASFFSGCGGLDLGFTNAGFKLVFANDNWKGCKETFELNHKIKVDTRSIADVKPSEVPDVVGFVGGPPCQSWSESGARRGIDDARGQLFFDYIRILKTKKPAFFLAENVSGMLAKRHSDAFKFIIKRFNDAGYRVEPPQLLNAKDYDVPQDRKRVFFVGYRKDLNIKFKFPEKSKYSCRGPLLFSLKRISKYCIVFLWYSRDRHIEVIYGKERKSLETDQKIQVRIFLFGPYGHCDVLPALPSGRAGDLHVVPQA